MARTQPAVKFLPTRLDTPRWVEEGGISVDHVGTADATARLVARRWEGISLAEPVRPGENGGVHCSKLESARRIASLAPPECRDCMFARVPTVSCGRRLASAGLAAFCVDQPAFKFGPSGAGRYLVLG